MEDEFAVMVVNMVVNARHMKAAPGRKTDVKSLPRTGYGDAEWIADLLQHGLLRAGFIPDRPQRELRELTRYRRSLTEERSREANRIQKLLEGANIKLSSVATDVLGASGRAMLRAMSEGEEDPKASAELAKGRLREKLGRLEEALRGMAGSHQRYMLASQLRHLQYLEAEIRRLDPFEEMAAALDTIPGVGRRTAQVIAAEVGTDMSQFPTPGHLASWAGVCPGNNQSADKRRRAPPRKGNNWLKPAPRFHEGRLWRRRPSPPDGPRPTWGAQYRRLARRIGAQRAAMAVAHSIVVILHQVIETGEPFADLGHRYFGERDRERDREAVTRRALRQLQSLGHKVTLEAA